MHVLGQLSLQWKKKLTSTWKKKKGYWPVQINGNKFATSQILRRPVEVVKGRILAGWAQKSPKPWSQDLAHISKWMSNFTATQHRHLPLWEFHVNCHLDPYAIATCTPWRTHPPGGPNDMISLLGTAKLAFYGESINSNERIRLDNPSGNDA